MLGFKAKPCCERSSSKQPNAGELQVHGVRYIDCEIAEIVTQNERIVVCYHIGP